MLTPQVWATQREIVAEAELLSPTSTVVGVHWPNFPAPDERQDHVLQALGEAARSLWPRWYATVEERFDRQRWPHTEIECRLQTVVGGVPGVSSNWFRSAWRRCQQDKRPTFRKMPAAEQLKQLALALDPSGPVLLLTVNGAFNPERLHALARMTEWLATQTGSQTILVLPEACHNRPELDAVNYGAIEHTPALPLAKDSEGTAGHATSPSVIVEPAIGSPHPGSQAENKLCKWLLRDPDLADLFQYNQLVSGFGDTRHRVDLLWPQGKLVVEVDGPEHRNPFHYRMDRDRDYRLLAAGYAVVRTTNEDVLEDVGLVIEKLRNVVRNQRSRESER